MTARSTDTYDVVSNREDLADIIYNISPTDTPFMYGSARGTATNTLHEWQIDTLASVDTANAAVEGADATFAPAAATTRQQNTTQISQKTVEVSGTQRNTDPAGYADEFAYQTMKRGEELKRDMESITTANQARGAGTSTTARTLRGLPAWYTTNVNAGAGGSNGSDSAARTDGTQRAFTEVQLKDVIQDTWTAGGNPDNIMVGARNKQILSSFTGNSDSYRMADDKKLTAAVDVYESDFGMLYITPNRFQRARDVHVLQTDMYAFAYLRPIQINDLAKIGDSDRNQLIVEYTLQTRNEASSGLVADTTV